MPESLVVKYWAMCLPKVNMAGGLSVAMQIKILFFRRLHILRGDHAGSQFSWTALLAWRYMYESSVQFGNRTLIEGIACI